MNGYHRAMIPEIVKSMNIFHNTVFKNWMPFSQNCCVKRNDKFYNVSLTIVTTDKNEINFSSSCKKEIQLCTLIHSVSPLNDSSRNYLSQPRSIRLSFCCLHKVKPLINLDTKWIKTWTATNRQLDN